MWKWNTTIIQRVDSSIDTRQPYILLYASGLLCLAIAFGFLISQSALFTSEIVVGLLLTVLALLQPRFSLILVFIAASLPSLLINLPGHTMRLVEPALYLCIVVSILRRPRVYLRYYHLLAVLFICIAVVSFLHMPQISTNPNAYAADKRLYEILLVFEAFFCGTCLSRYISSASSLLSTLLLCNIPLYLIGLAQAVSLQLPAFLEVSGAQDPTQNGGRLWGPADGAVTFGLYLVNLLAISLSCYLLGKKRRDRVFGGIMTVATTLELIGSGTRSAALAGIAMILILLLLTRRYKLLLGLLSMAIAALIVFFNRIVPLFAHDQSSISNRLFLWHEALGLILTHPWVGIGLQQFYVYYDQLIIAPSNALNSHGISVHNQYLELALESGIFWLIVAVLFLFSVLYTCWRTYRIAQREQQVLLLAAMLALVANILIGFFDVPLDKVEGSVVLFMLVGIALGYTEPLRHSGRHFFAKTRVSKQRRSLRSSILGIIRATSLSCSLPVLLCRYLLMSPYKIYTNLRRRLARARANSSSSNTAPDPQKTVRSITFQLICWGLTGPIMLPVTALLTRYLGPVQYGEYGFTLPFLAICALLSGTGMDPLIIRLLSRLPRNEWGKTLSYAAGSRFFLTALSVSIISLLALLLPFSVEQRDLLVCGCLSLFFNFSYNGLRAIYSHGFRAEQRVSPLILLETADRLLTAVMVVVVVIFRLPLLWAYILIIYADLPCCIALMLIARHRFGIHLRLSLRHLREHVINSLSLTGYDALTLLTGQADVILLMLFTGPLNVGLYALAIRISDPLLSVAYMYVNGIYPLLCSTFEVRREQFAAFYKEAMRIISLAVIPPAIFVSVQADAVVSLVGGQHFAASAVVVQLLMWATATIFYSQLAVRCCMAANMERWIPYVAGAAAVVNLLGNLILIPLWQTVGAGLAALISELLTLVLFTFLLRRHIQILPTLGVILQVFVGNGLMLAFLLWQRHASLLLTAPIALLLTVTGCFMARALSWRDVQMIRLFLFSRFHNHATFTFPSATIPTSPQPDLPAISNYHPSQFQDISDYPTLILPRIRV
jgi:O-antigen/teichoic acid export membrane protein